MMLSLAKRNRDIRNCVIRGNRRMTHDWNVERQRIYANVAFTLAEAPEQKCALRSDLRGQQLEVIGGETQLRKHDAINPPDRSRRILKKLHEPLTARCGTFVGVNEVLEEAISIGHRMKATLVHLYELGRAHDEGPWDHE